MGPNLLLVWCIRTYVGRFHFYYEVLCLPLHIGDKLRYQVIKSTAVCYTGLHPLAVPGSAEIPALFIQHHVIPVTNLVNVYNLCY